LSGSIEEILGSHRVCICAGSGGVGKTTTSAAIGVGMATRGKKVAVLTIDPAKRLADSLGLAELGNAPGRVDISAIDDPANPGRHGELWAMMLDSKATFDDLIDTYAPDEQARDRVLGNRIYKQISGALAGSQEYMAMEKLYELHSEGDYDLLILDTPPSRNALDFLDAPQRVTRFIEGRAMRLFIRPTGLGARVAGRGFGVVSSVLRRITGGDLIADLSEFFSAMAGLLGGFRDRAERVEALLRDADTTFLVVTGPAGEPIEEAAYLRRKLADGGLPFGGLIVNRVHPLVAGAGGSGTKKASAALRKSIGDASLTDRILAAAADQAILADRDRRNIDALTADEPGTPLIEVPELSDEIHDIEGLQALGRHLFGKGADQG
jgi:anion-transporting  ArsA/GET3 family ATPase